MAIWTPPSWWGQGLGIWGLEDTRLSLWASAWSSWPLSSFHSALPAWWRREHGFVILTIKGGVLLSMNQTEGQFFHPRCAFWTLDNGPWRLFFFLIVSRWELYNVQWLKRNYRICVMLAPWHWVSRRQWLNSSVLLALHTSIPVNNVIHGQQDLGWKIHLRFQVMSAAPEICEGKWFGECWMHLESGI